MLNPTLITAHMPVLGSDGREVGTVDHIEGDRIKLERNGGRSHYIPLYWVATIDDKVRLGRPGAQVIREWQSV